MSTKIVSKKGNPSAPNVDHLVVIVTEPAPALGLDLGEFSNSQLLNLSKDRRIVGMKQTYNEVIQYHKFMQGDPITQENYDKIKRMIHKDYQMKFYNKPQVTTDKKTGIEVLTEIPMCQNLTTTILESKVEAGTLLDKEITEVNHFMIDNQSKLEHAQAHKLALQSQVKMAQAIAHTRQAKELAEAKGQVKDVNTIWKMVTAREEGKKFTEYKPPTPEELPEEKQILASF